MLIQLLDAVTPLKILTFQGSQPGINTHVHHLQDIEFKDGMCVHVIMPYLDVVLQLLPPLLQRFGPQVGVPFAGEIWCLHNLPELKVTKEVKSTLTV